MAWKFQYKSFQKKRFQARDISWNIPVERGRNKQAQENNKTVFSTLLSCVFGDENESIVKSFISSIIYMTSNSTEVFISDREHTKQKVSYCHWKLLIKKYNIGWISIR